jgi:DNA-binding MarR family transcriptional regulator
MERCRKQMARTACEVTVDSTKYRKNRSAHPHQNYLRKVLSLTVAGLIAAKLQERVAGPTDRREVAVLATPSQADLLNIVLALAELMQCI